VRRPAELETPEQRLQLVTIPAEHHQLTRVSTWR
jgi:hypothetical protein